MLYDYNMIIKYECIVVKYYMKKLFRSTPLTQLHDNKGLK
jgi:hypothetical protein